MCTLIPKTVLGGARLVLLGSIAVAGIRILSAQVIDHKALYLMAVPLAFGLGVALVPDVQEELPQAPQQLLGSPMTISGLMAILLTVVLPDGPDRASAG